MSRTGITKADLVEAAAQIIDDTDLASLTMAALARRVGLALPSLYTHVRSLEHLRLEVSLTVTEDLSRRMGEAIQGLAGRDALAALANAYRAYAVAHPGRYAASMVVKPDAADPRFPAAALKCATVIYGTLRGYGLGQPNLIPAGRFLRAALHGFTSIEGQGGFALADVDASFAALVEALDRALTSWPRTTSGPLK